MKHFKFYTFGDVDVAVFKCDDEDENPAIKFVAIGPLGTIEAAPSFDEVEDRDNAWDNNTESISKSIAQMVEEAFVVEE